MCLLNRQNRLKKNRSLLRRQLKMCLLPHKQPLQGVIRLDLSRGEWNQGPCAIRVIRDGQCRHVRWVQGRRLVSLRVRNLLEIMGLPRVVAPPMVHRGVVSALGFRRVSALEPQVDRLIRHVLVCLSGHSRNRAPSLLSSAPLRSE